MNTNGIIPTIENISASVGGEAYLVHGGHVGAPLVAALDPDAGCSTLSPGVQAAHTPKHLAVNSYEQMKPGLHLEPR